jgi:DNA polymerase-3 subunit beta
MKVTLERADLLRALTAAAAVVERRATVPVLMNVLIEAADDQVRIVASDLEIQLGITVPAQVEQAGAVTVAAQLFQTIVRELDEGAQVQLELGSSDQGDRLQLTSNRSRYRLPVIAASDFPLCEPVKGAVSFALACGDLAGMLKSIAYAMSTEETRFYLMGVHIDVRGDRLALAATNGQILAVAERSVPKGAELLERGIILHRKLIGELVKLVDGVEGEIGIATDYERVTLTLGGIQIISKLIDGDYPDWRRHIPSDHEHILKVRTAALAAAVRRAVAVSDEKARGVRADFKRDALQLSLRSALNGTAEEEVPCSYDAAEFPVGLSSRYLLDTLDAIGADEVELALKPEGQAGGAPANILLTSPARPDGQWMIAPMRI